MDARREVGAYLEARLKAATEEVEELRRSSGTRGRESQTKLERSKADENLGVAGGAKAAEEAKAAAREKVADERRTADEDRIKAAAKAKLRANVAAQTKDLETKDEDLKRRVTKATCKWKAREPEGASATAEAVAKLKAAQQAANAKAAKEAKAATEAKAAEEAREAKAAA